MKTLTYYMSDNCMDYRAYFLTFEDAKLAAYGQFDKELSDPDFYMAEMSVMEFTINDTPENRAVLSRLMRTTVRDAQWQDALLLTESSVNALFSISRFRDEDKATFEGFEGKTN